MQIENCKLKASPWPHRWAVALACATFPLLWVGGLVTTTDAGMAVPDWPNTYGYNLFLYPWSSWLSGPWDVFVEHGHRLLGAAVGLITIALVASLCKSDSRRWVCGLGFAALGLVIFQGVLGGMRVLLAERTLAMFHGCTGPVFFALSVALAIVTSKSWQKRGADIDAKAVAGSRLRYLATVTCVLVYLQIVLGAVLRHVPAITEPTTFATAVRFHLFMAAVVTLHIGMLAAMVLIGLRGVRPLGGLAVALVALLGVQLALGAGTWIVKFSVPHWAAGWVPAPGAAIQDGGWLQVHTITAHVAVGSLLFATSLALALWTQRLRASRSMLLTDMAVPI
jgi:cytochrome c oxidase assembly protein subunit 15